MLGFWLMVLLFLALLLAGPWWPFSRGWGYTPAAVLLGVLAVWLLVVWLGWIAFFWPWVGTPAVVPPGA